MHTQQVNVGYHCLSSKKKGEMLISLIKPSTVKNRGGKKEINELLMLDPSNLNKILNDGLQGYMIVYKYLSVQQVKRRCCLLRCITKFNNHAISSSAVTIIADEPA